MNDYNLDLLGRRLLVENGSKSLIEWLEQNWCFPEHLGMLLSDWQFRLTYYNSPEPPDLREQSTKYPEIMRLPGLLVSQNSSIWLFETESAVNLTLERDSKKVVIGWYGEVNNSMLLHQTLCEAMRSSGLIPLHTSVVVRDGQATAFLGPSGMGKTTTMLQFVARGWQPLCEDFAWLEPELLMLFSWDRKLHLLPDTLEKLDKLFPGIQVEPFNGRKYPLKLEALSPRVWSGQLAALVLLKRDRTQESGWMSLESIQSLIGVYDASGLPRFKEFQQPFADTVAKLLSQIELKAMMLGKGDLPL